MALVGVLCAIALVSCADPAPVGSSTAAAKAGDCHRIPTPEAMVAASDNSPVIPCTEPHEAEVFLTLQYHGRYAKRPTRPQPEQLQGEAGDQCTQYLALRAYLGAGTHDDHWGLQVWPRFPSRAEWAEGVRTMRCDLVRDSGASGPVMTTSLRDILQRKDSAAFRLCYRGSRALTCDKPHDAEMLAGPPVLPAGPYPGHDALVQQATEACAPSVRDYLGEDLPPDLAIRPRVPTRQRWTKGDHHVDCAIGAADHRLVTGTVRGGLQ